MTKESDWKTLDFAVQCSLPLFRAMQHPSYVTRGRDVLALDFQFRYSK